MTDPADVSTNVGAAQMSNDEKTGARKYLRFALMLPLTFILIAAAVVLEVLKLQGPVVNYAMIIFAIIFLVLETMKVTRVDKAKFLFEVIVAAAGVGIAAALLTFRLTQDQTNPALYHWVVLAVLFYDATVTPYLAYSNALRDMSVGGAAHGGE